MDPPAISSSILGTVMPPNLISPFFFSSPSIITAPCLPARTAESVGFAPPTPCAARQSFSSSDCTCVGAVNVGVAAPLPPPPPKSLAAPFFPPPNVSSSISIWTALLSSNALSTVCLFCGSLTNGAIASANSRLTDALSVHEAMATMSAQAQ